MPDSPIVWVFLILVAGIIVAQLIAALSGRSLKIRRGEFTFLARNTRPRD